MFAERAASPQAVRVEEPLKAVAQMSAQEVVEELSVVAARQAELVTQLKAQAVVEGGSLAQKDEQIALLKAQLAGAQAEALAAAEYAKKAIDEKLTALSELQRECGEVQQYKSNLTWGLRYLEEKKTVRCDQLADFGKKVESAVEVQEEKLRGLSIEYDEELYPHLMSMIAERRYLLYIIL